jgi:hypothetical protein
MYADTIEELHAMALRIGMKREWFQGGFGRMQHYDLVASRRLRAVNAGAIEHTRKEMVAFIQKQRADRRAALPDREEK